MILRPLEGPTGTGPIDDLARHETQLECPVCHAFAAWQIPAQSGPCHSGQFTNSCIEYFWCEACETVLTDAP